jgi:hypothetical protein
VVALPATVAATASVQALWADAHTLLVAFTGSSILERRDESGWHEEALPFSGTINALWGNSTDFCGVGDTAAIYVRTSGGDWRVEPAPPQETQRLTAVTRGLNGDLFAAGTNGAIYRRSVR